MESHFQKPSLQLKVSAKIVNGIDTIPRTSTSTTNESKAPITRAQTITSSSKTIVSEAKTVQVQPGLADVTIKPERVDLKTMIKPVTKQVSPATTAGSIGRAGASVVAAATAIPSGPKPSKWDLKGRLEYTNNELTALKQKHRELTIQYNNIQEKIIRLRESEKSNKFKVKSLEAIYIGLNERLWELSYIFGRWNESLEAEIGKLKKKNTGFEKELEESNNSTDIAISWERKIEELIKKNSGLKKQSQESHDSTERAKTLEAKIEELTKKNTGLEKQVQEFHDSTERAKTLEAKIEELTKKNTGLEKQVQESKEFFKKASALLSQCLLITLN